MEAWITHGFSLLPRALLTTIAQRLMYQLWRRRDLERAYLDALDQDETSPAPSPEDLAQMLSACCNTLPLTPWVCGI